MKMSFTKNKIGICLLAVILSVGFLLSPNFSAVYADDNDNAPMQGDGNDKLESVIFEIFVEKADFANKTSDFHTIDNKTDIEKVIPGYKLENLKFAVSVNGGEEKIVNAKYAGVTNHSGWISIGDYNVGDKLKVRLITETLPDNYHLMAGEYPGEGNKEFESPSFEFKVYHLDPAKNEKGVMTFAQQIVAFDPDGNVFADGSKEIKESQVTKDSTLHIPDGPIKDGYIFKGWFCKRINSDKGRILKPGIKKGAVQKDYFIAYEPASSTNKTRGYGYTIAKPLFAKAVTVNFYDADKKLIDTQVIEKDTKVKPVMAPALANKEFVNWLDKNGKPFNLESKVGEDMDLYATYTGLPILKVKDMSVTKGDNTFTLLKPVISATDTEDGDLYAQVIVLDKGNFDINKTGKYEIKYAVKDKDGHQAIAIAKVTVMDKNMVNAEMQKGPNTGDSGILVALLSLAVASIALVLINRAKVNK